MLFEEYLLKTKQKAELCRHLFTKIEQRYNKLSPSAFEKANWILCFLAQSEHSYLLRVKKLAEELDAKK